MIDASDIMDGIIEEMAPPSCAGIDAVIAELRARARQMLDDGWLSVSEDYRTMARTLGLIKARAPELAQMAAELWEVEK